MKPPLEPTDEAGRLQALRQYEVLDTLPDQALDDLTLLAAHICEAPIALISLIDEHRQWFKSKVGLSADETSRDISFCGHAILEPGLFIVPDTMNDQRFIDNPLVTGDPQIRFYAGVPLVTAAGHALGTLCVLDRVPRELTLIQQDALRVLSRQVIAQLELHRKTRELGASNERFLLVARATNDAVWDWNLGTNALSWNEGYHSLFGHAPAATDPSIESWITFIHPDEVDRVKRGIHHAIDHGASTWSDEYRFQRRDGTFAQILDRGSIIRTAEGKAVRMIGAMQDITERKLATEALSASEARYRTLFDCAGDGIVIADSASYYVDANPSMCRMLGYTHNELIGLNASDIVAPAEVQNIGPALKEIKAKADYHREWRFRRKDGSVFAAEVTASVMPDGRLLGMIRDIAERKRIEARFRRLVDSNAQGVIFWNTNGCITGANDAFLRMVRYTREDLDAGRIGAASTTPPEFIEADRHAAEVLAATGVCPPYEKEFIRKDGSRVAVLIGSAAFEDNPEEGVSFVLDLTERKDLERQFLRARRMESVGTLAGGIAHDLNNVLTPILLSVETLKEMVTTEEGLGFLTTVEASARRGAALVQQVLSFARGVEGQRITVNPLHLIRDLLKVMRETFPKFIDVRLRSTRDLWTVTGDPTQIHQVFLNLCVNARDAMPNGGILTVGLENVVLDGSYAAINIDARPGTYVMVKVVDTGTGIAPEIRDRIFEPFFTTKEVGKGTGLGLSTTLAIVKSHGGFIDLSSEVGAGTTFKVYLPANTSETAADNSHLAQLDPPRGSGELVLVVDDEYAIRRIVQGTLERFGYGVLLAANGAEAVALYAEHRQEIAIVLTDMAMPVMDGPATIVALKVLNPAVRIIGSSGLASEAAVAKAVEAGVRHFVPKPYTAETMLRALQRVLNEEEECATDRA
ncbi:MAG: PAS domain S-box protein [Gemmatimonadota bacterium]